MSHSPDVIVVGGGIVGLATCLSLVQAGMRVLCVEDSSLERTSASLASGAMLGALGEVESHKTQLADRAETEFRLHCATIYPEWIKAIEEECGTKIDVSYGTYVVANAMGEDDVANIDEIAKVASANRRKFEFVDPADVSAIFPNKRLSPLKTLFLPDEGCVNSHQLIAALKATLSLSNRCTFLDDSVISFMHDSGCVRGVFLKAGPSINAPYVILCAGVGTTPIIYRAGVGHLGVPRVLGGKGSSTIARSNLDISAVVRTPNRDYACGLHVVPMGQGEYYLGATNRITELHQIVPHSSVGELHGLLHGIVNEINLNFKSSSLIALRCGLRPLCIDGYPVIGQTELEGLFVATGTYRNGMLMAPGIATILTDQITKRSSLDFVFSPSHRAAIIGRPSLRETILKSVSDLVAYIQDPHGALPFNRAEELSDFVSGILLSRFESGEIKGIFDEYVSNINEMPSRDALPLLFVKLHNYFNKIRGRPPMLGDE